MTTELHFRTRMLDAVGESALARWAYGEHAYGQRKALFEDGGPLAHMDFYTLATYGWVCRQVQLRSESKF